MKKKYQYSKSSKVEVTLSQEFCAQQAIMRCENEDRYEARHHSTDS